MKAHLSQLMDWLEAGKQIALATVIQTWGSAPRPIGSTLAINSDMEMIGSVSGGCIEGVLLKEALEVIENGQPKLLEYGVSNAEAWAVGLSCGGTIRIYLEPFTTLLGEESLWNHLQTLIYEHSGGTLITSINSSPAIKTLLFPDGQTFGSKLASNIQAAALQAYQNRSSQLLEVDDQVYFLHVFPKCSRLLILGAVDIGAQLVELATVFDFETIVIDPREVFITKTHFRKAPDQLLQLWPQEILPKIPLDAYTYAVLLTHDPKIDDPALEVLLASDIAYIGALGGRKSQEKRQQRMRALGIAEENISRIKGPVGLAIHAQSAREVALSILAEIIQVKNEHL